MGLLVLAALGEELRDLPGPGHVAEVGVEGVGQQLLDLVRDGS